MMYPSFTGSIVRSNQWMDEPAVNVKTWVALLSFCADQENGGSIDDCADWTDRKWLTSVGVSKSEVSADSFLWQWRDKSLYVEFYGLNSELVHRGQKAAALATNKTRWGTNGKHP